jgi:hypothetical protein
MKGSLAVYLLDHAMLLSAVAGVACGLFVAGTRRGMVLVASLSVLAILASLLWHEYVEPYEGGGASMWPIAFVILAIPAAACGCVGCGCGQVLRWMRESRRGRG